MVSKSSSPSSFDLMVCMDTRTGKFPAPQNLNLRIPIGVVRRMAFDPSFSLLRLKPFPRRFTISRPLNLFGTRCNLDTWIGPGVVPWTFILRSLATNYTIKVWMIIYVKSKLKEVNSPLSQEDMVAYALMGLPRDYEAFITSITNGRHPVTFEDLQTKLIHSEPVFKTRLDQKG